jgi:zinc protease
MKLKKPVTIISLAAALAITAGVAMVWAVPSLRVHVPSISLITSSVVPAQARTKIFNASHYTLANGLQVVVIPNHRAPVVTHMVLYKVGAADEVLGTSGIAHFLEHLMFKGTPGFPPGEFSKAIRAMGGNDNAFTSDDFTAYFQSVPADKLETVMRMEAGRMRGVNPPPDHFLSERKVIVEERSQRTDNNPEARFSEQMDAMLFVNHPYAKPIIGWKNEMEALTWDDAKAFYDRWYGPNNAILVVSGDVTGDQVLALAQTIYGPVAKTDVPERARPIVPPLDGLPELTMRDPLVKEPMVQTIYRAPSSRQNKQESLALQVLQEIMSGGSSARLYRILVAEQKIATDAGLSYSGDAWDDGRLSLYAIPSEGQDIRALKTALDDQLRSVIKDGVTDQEVRDAISRMRTQVIYSRDSLSGPAMIFGQALTTGSTIDDIEYWDYDIQTVTAAQIQDAAKKYMNPDDAARRAPVTGYLLPADIPATPALVKENPAL